MNTPVRFNNNATKYYLETTQDDQITKLENIEFINSMEDNILYVSYNDQENETLRVSQYEWRTAYTFPYACFELLKEEEEQNECENLSNIVEHNKIWLTNILKKNIFIILGLVLFWFILLNINYNLNNDKSREVGAKYIDIKQETILNKNKFEELTNQKNANNKEISKELQAQKLLRDQKAEVNKKLDFSKEKVGECIKQNQELEKELFTISQ